MKIEMKKRKKEREKEINEKLLAALESRVLRTVHINIRLENFCMKKIVHNYRTYVFNKHDVSNKR